MMHRGETVTRRSKTSDSTLTTIVSRLIETYQPERVYLFGSAARGDAGPDSDYDLLLVMPDDSPDELLNAGRARKSGCPRAQRDSKRRLRLRPRQVVQQRRKEGPDGSGVCR